MTLFCRLHTQSIFLIYTRIIGRIHSHSGQSKRGALWDAWWTDSRRSSSQSGQLRYGSLWNSQWQPAHMKKSSLCSMIWQNRHSTLHGSGGGGGGVVGRGAFSEDKGLGSDDGDGGDSGTPPGCWSGDDCGEVTAPSNCEKTSLSELAR